MGILQWALDQPYRAVVLGSLAAITTGIAYIVYWMSA